MNAFTTENAYFNLMMHSWNNNPPAVNIYVSFGAMDEPISQSLLIIYHKIFEVTLLLVILF
jgi:hypothetical protein